MEYVYVTMKDDTTHTQYGSIMSGFQQLTNKLVEKYCAMPLPYKPGLYSIHWESSYRISGLLNELNTNARQILQGLDNDRQTINISSVRGKLHDIIHQSLLLYIEKIYGADYADSVQPEWMVQIAKRLQQNASVSF